MKVLFYSYKSCYSGKSYGGAERSMTLLAESLVHLDCEVHYLSGVDNVRFSFPKIDFKNGVIVHFLPIFRLPFMSISFIRKLSELIRTRIFYSYMSLKFRDFNIVCVCNEYPALYQMVNWRVSNKLKCRIVYRTAGLYWHNNILKNYPFLREKIEWSFNYVDSVNFISQEMKRSFLKIKDKHYYDFDLMDQFILDIGVKFNSKNTWVVNGESPYTIVMVARFSDYAKRQDVLMEAFRIWNNSNSRLIFFGDGPMLDHYKKIINNDLFLSEHVELRGFVEPVKVKEQLLKAHLFALCTDYEGVPKSVLEAMSIGIPVLVSDIEAHNSIIEHGENGFVASNVPELWKEELSRIYELTSDQLSLISKNAMFYIQSHHSLENSANKYLSEFKRIVDLPR
ncbi:glycosyltransferase involved in cell wall biosynthesis [Roseivirga ehrenbergii]|uniref:Glycosyl transferase family 1 domain-containing protein n=1 Tax=Roseivirga ehrenbergii (strain DSM 102268 / JCM 13514 / KCTC 12282 / NCIMB 14502 / KMM 6017) TaxID=279360 RepID=A0A150XED6_ROSEK|nr:glycosyltransferase family 4 protein [Roseivirga ehrenbergii]KYG77052.1 hypothetical protein MB14_02290 [Roseivirga ehrenbergii]TCL14445.1 glycosyltransferase involved in cell wall biosynthesis [Roseivirga ehrenbergii]